MSKVIIVGAHGKVALLTAPRLVAAGHQVTGVIRNVEQSDDVRRTGAEAVVADVENLSTDEIAEFLAGHDVVVWSAGAGGAARSGRTPWTATRRSARSTPPARPRPRSSSWFRTSAPVPTTAWIRAATSSPTRSRKPRPTLI